MGDGLRPFGKPADSPPYPTIARAPHFYPDLIKVELAAIGQMRPGSLTRQYKDPASQSGAYYQLSYTLDMKSRTDYIPRNWVPQVRAQVANYKRFKSLSTEWVSLSIERCRLIMKLMDTP